MLACLFVLVSPTESLQTMRRGISGEEDGEGCGLDILLLTKVKEKVLSRLGTPIFSTSGELEALVRALDLADCFLARMIGAMKK